MGTGKRAIRGFQLALRIQVRRLSSPLFPNSAGPDDQGDVPGPGARHPHSRAAAVLYRRARRGRHSAGSRRRRSCGGAEGKPAGRRGASGCIGRRPRPRCRRRPLEAAVLLFYREHDPAARIFPEEARLRCLSHPMDPRTVPVCVPRENRELVTNARCMRALTTRFNNATGNCSEPT